MTHAPGAARSRAAPSCRCFWPTIVVSFYVGYFGAGAGFLFMTLLAFFGYEDIHAINALKVVANLLANGIAFVIFIVDGQVVWRFCLAAMIAAAIGGYFSASLAKRVPQPVLRGSWSPLGWRWRRGFLETVNEKTGTGGEGKRAGARECSPAGKKARRRLTEE